MIVIQLFTEMDEKLVVVANLDRRLVVRVQTVVDITDFPDRNPMLPLRNEFHDNVATWNVQDETFNILQN